MKKILIASLLTLCVANFTLIDSSDSLSEKAIIEPRENESSALNQILEDNQKTIDRAIELIANTEDDIDTFLQKAFDLEQEHYNFILKNNDLLNRYPEYREQLDMQWANALVEIYQSMHYFNSLQNQKKIIAIKIIALGIGQDLNGYLNLIKNNN